LPTRKRISRSRKPAGRRKEHDEQARRPGEKLSAIKLSVRRKRSRCSPRSFRGPSRIVFQHEQQVQQMSSTVVRRCSEFNVSEGGRSNTQTLYDGRTKLTKTLVGMCYCPLFYYYYFLHPGTKFPGNEQITLCNTEKYKTQVGMQACDRV